MISFRFHLVSLVGVFLALGLGVLAGTTVLNKGIVTVLEAQTRELRETSASLRDRVERLEGEARMWSAFGTEAMEHLVSDRLAGTDVILITQEGTDGAGLQGVRRAMDGAGADLLAVFSIDQRMSLDRGSDRQALALAIGTPDGDPRDLQAQAAEALAIRLAFGSSGDDVLARLIEAGFLVNQGPGLDGDALRQLGGNGEVFVFVAGGQNEPAPAPSEFLVPLVRRLVLQGETVAAAENLETQYEFVGLLRGDGAVSGQMVTQDNVDRVPGEVGLVLALRDLMIDGRSGHYGVKGGADGTIPSPADG
jgi:Copper transport outer membrane protein, MctB